jgi:diaminopimelate epimerase
MSGAGNDFVVIDNRSALIDNGAALAKRICDRHWGVGADGLLLLESSDKVPYRMMYYNADGSYGGMCGNGGRCIAMFAYQKDIVGAKHSFEALNHIYSACIEDDTVTLQMKDPKSISLNKIITVGRKKISFHFVDTGAPHVVININELSKKNDLDGIDVQYWGKLLRWHKIFMPEGTNVNFVKLLNNNTIQLRTFERGVEAETLACGTGSIAAAIIAYKKWKLFTPIKIIPRSNVQLIISFDTLNCNIRNVKLCGTVAITFTGSIDV